MSRVIVYDCTLRDGMQGEGMSLSAEEKVRVAHVLDGLGVPLIEAGFPASNPKEEEFFALLARETFRTREIAAFGMTRRRDVRADEDPALRLLADSFAPVCTLVGKSWGLHLEKVVEVDRDENLRMIEDSVAFLVAQGKRVVYDAEHFFDALRRRPRLRAALRAGRRRGRRRVGDAVRHQRRPLPHEIAAATAAVVAALGDAGRHPLPQRRRVRRGQLARRRARGRRHGAGHDERLRRALRQREPRLDRPEPAAQARPRVPARRSSGLTEASALPRRAAQLRRPSRNRPYVGANAFAHKGGMHVAGVNADPATFEHIDPAAVGNTREVLISELSGKGTVLAARRGDGRRARRRPRRRAWSSASRQLEHEGYHFEAADGSFDLLIRRETGEYQPLFRLESWRVIAEKREDGRVQTEATIKIWVDGERYVRTAEGNGPVHALDRALRARDLARSTRTSRDIRLVNFKVRILDEWKATGATTRVLLDASDGTDTWGAIGVHENVIEASWDALVDSLEAGMLPGRVAHHRRRGRDAGAMTRAELDVIPLARPVIGAREEELVLEVLRSGQLSLGPRVPAFEAAFAARLGARHACAVSSGTAGLHLALRAAGVGEGDEVVTSPFSFVASANVVLYERARPVFVDIDPDTLNCDPAAAAAAVTERTSALLPVHIFGYPADVPALERHGLPIVEDACEALGAVHADGTPVGGRGHPRSSASTPTSR